MEERKTGVFNTIKKENTAQECGELIPVSENNPDTIYNLLFKKYDEES
ncbi:MAG: hypothetical protein UD936_04685 [Acutalibacteraceae bacterium]|nr:hypothetical protein [Acutalibacteraceae bacterium]